MVKNPPANTGDVGLILGSRRSLEKGDPGSLEEWETVVGDDFSLYYDSYSLHHGQISGLEVPVES